MGKQPVIWFAVVVLAGAALGCTYLYYVSAGRHSNNDAGQFAHPTSVHRAEPAQQEKITLKQPTLERPQAVDTDRDLVIPDAEAGTRGATAQSIDPRIDREGSTQTEADWWTEFADKSPAELRAASTRLLEEQEADLTAEAERRLADGRYNVYPQGEPLPFRVTGTLVARGDELALRVVHLDPRLEPELYWKLRKAIWLHREARRRK